MFQAYFEGEDKLFLCFSFLPEYLYVSDKHTRNRYLVPMAICSVSLGEPFLLCDFPLGSPDNQKLPVSNGRYPTKLTSHATI